MKSIATILGAMALGAAFLVSPAAAQPQAPPAARTQTIIPADRALTLRNPPGIRFTPPTPAEAEQIRKVNMLRGMGLNVTTAALGASIWLTPQHPFENAQALLQVADTAPAAAEYGSSTEFPYGIMPITRSPRGGAWWVGVRFPTTPFQYALVECIVGGATEFGVQYTILDTGSEANSAIRLYKRPASGRIAFVVNPQASPSRQPILWGVGESGRWNFGGCEITPVNPR